MKERYSARGPSPLYNPSRDSQESSQGEENEAIVDPRPAYDSSPPFRPSQTVFTGQMHDTWGRGSSPEELPAVELLDKLTVKPLSGHLLAGSTGNHAVCPKLLSGGLWIEGRVGPSLG